MKSIALTATILAALVAYQDTRADEYTDQQQLQVLQQMQQQQQTQFLIDYGRQSEADWEARMPEARGRAIREKYAERRAYENLRRMR